MKKHEPIELTSAERIDLASITKHPGMGVIQKILKGHVDQQLAMVFDVQPDDPDRTTKLDGIGSVAYAMKLTHELFTNEVKRNWEILQREEKK